MVTCTIILLHINFAAIGYGAITVPPPANGFVLPGGLGGFNPPLVVDDPLTGDRQFWSGGVGFDPPPRCSKIAFREHKMNTQKSNEVMMELRLRIHIFPVSTAECERAWVQPDESPTDNAKEQASNRVSKVSVFC